VKTSRSIAAFSAAVRCGPNIASKKSSGEGIDDSWIGRPTGLRYDPSLASESPRG
jgi:hypothetical protein